MNKNIISSLYTQKTFPVNIFSIENIHDRIILYGAGECSHWFIEVIMKMRGVNPIAVLDKRFLKDDTFEGISAYSPEKYYLSEKEKQSVYVVVAVGSQLVFNEIKKYLTGLGYQNIVWLLEIYEIHNPFSLPKELYRKGYDYFVDKKDDIVKAFEFLGDDESRDIYVKYLHTHMTRNPISLPCKPRNEQYFPKDIKLNKGYSRFINCGSYDGDFLRLLNSTYGKIQAIACFEPEPKIYKKLSEYLKSKGKHLADNIVSFPCAVYEKECLKNFNSASGLGSRISDDGNIQVKCVSLDNALPGFNPTFISMDIEGVELEALMGSESIIQNSKPDLGICVYHSPNQIWEILLYLHNLNIGYKFYLRNYTSYIYETVLYATSETY